MVYGKSDDFRKYETVETRVEWPLTPGKQTKTVPL